MVELKDPDIWPLTFLASISSSSGAAKSPLAIRLSKMAVRAELEPAHENLLKALQVRLRFPPPRSR